MHPVVSRRCSAASARIRLVSVGLNRQYARIPHPARMTNQYNYPTGLLPARRGAARRGRSCLIFVRPIDGDVRGRGNVPAGRPAAQKLVSEVDRWTDIQREREDRSLDIDERSRVLQVAVGLVIYISTRYHIAITGIVFRTRNARDKGN